MLYFDTGSAKEWLDFLQSFKSLSRMKGWQQGSGVGPTIFRNLQILLQGTALSRFEAHATNIGAQTTAHAFACLHEMTAEFFVLHFCHSSPSYCGSKGSKVGNCLIFEKQRDPSTSTSTLLN
jgi:hypothetical protein